MSVIHLESEPERPEVVQPSRAEGVRARAAEALALVREELSERRGERDRHNGAIRALVAQEELLSRVLGVFERAERKEGSDA